MWSLQRYREWLENRTNWHLRNTDSGLEPVDSFKNSNHRTTEIDYLSSKPGDSSLSRAKRLKKSVRKRNDVAETDGPYEIKDVDNLDDILRELDG
jgi:hypothetical protein